MGRQFYDGTLPRIAKALERIANALEATKAPPPAPDTVVLDRELFDMAHAAVAFAVGASGGISIVVQPSNPPPTETP